MTACPRHKHCAYTGTEPGLCQTCHASAAKCAGRHGNAPADGSWRLGATARPLNPALREGQYLHPREAHRVSSSWDLAQHHSSEEEFAA
jgi:hypothetical protein